MTVKWHNGENATPGRRGGKRMSQGVRGEGRVNHDTAPSTKGITRMKVRPAQLAYWALNKQND